MESIRQDEPKKDIGRQYRLRIGLATARIIGNRREAGLSTNIEFLEHSFHELGMREWISEFIVDPGTRRRVTQGLAFGLIVTNVVPHAYLIGPPKNIGQ